MSLKNYIAGSRKGKEAHHIELEAMKDLFLSEALQGYDIVKDHDHLQYIKRIEQNIERRNSNKFSLLQITSIAASLLVFIALGIYFMMYKSAPYFNNSAIAYTDEVNYEKTFESASLSNKISEPLPLRVSHQMVIPEPEPFIDIPVTGEPKPIPGIKAFKKYLYENLSIPAIDECGLVKGKVVLAFKVNAIGRPYNINIIESLCPSADQEALRVIQEGPNWTTGDKEVFCTIKF